MKKIITVLLLAVLCAGTNLMGPTTANAETCGQCCNRIAGMAASYPQLTLQMIISGEAPAYDPWTCLALGVAAGTACCSGMNGCSDISEFGICFTMGVAIWTNCVEATKVELQAGCSCCSGCP